MAGEVDYVASYTIHHPDGDIRLECQSMKGGHPTAQGGTSRNPVTGRTRARGGLPDRENLSCEVEIELAIWALKNRIEASVDRDRYTAVKQFVDSRRAPVGDPQTRTGIHGTSEWSDFDINAGDNTSMLAIESQVDG